MSEEYYGSEESEQLHSWLSQLWVKKTTGKSPVPKYAKMTARRKDFTDDMVTTQWQSK